MIELFNSLTKEELVKFEDFVNSPYFNKYRTLVKLFYFLKEKYPDIKKEDISNRKISLYIYSKVKISDARFRKLTSDFSILISKFLRQTGLEFDQQAGSFAEYYAFKRKGSFDKCTKLLNKIEKHQSKVIYKLDKYYLNRIDLLGERYERNMQLGQDSSGPILEKIKYVQYYFLFNSLNNIITFLINNRNNKEVLQNFPYMYDQILQSVKNSRKEIFKDHPLIVIYYYVAQMIFEFDDRYYEDLVKYYASNKKIFNFEMLQEYHLCIEIYFHLKINVNFGDENYNRTELFKMDKLAYGKDQYYEKYFQKGRYIEAYKFMFTIKNAISVNEIKWAEDFITKHHKNILPVQKEAIYDLSMAIISLVKNDYDNTLAYLKNVPLSHQICYVEAKMLRIMVWLETNNKELFKNEMSSFKKSINNDPEINDITNSLLKNFLNYLNSIFKLKNEKEKNIKDEVYALQKKLSNEKSLFDYRFWLILKLDELSVIR